MFHLRPQSIHLRAKFVLTRLVRRDETSSFVFETRREFRLATRERRLRLGVAGFRARRRSFAERRDVRLGATREFVAFGAERVEVSSARAGGVGGGVPGASDVDERGVASRLRRAER